MTQQTVYYRVCRVINEGMGVDIEDINENSHIINDLGADSLDCVELVMDLEDEFGIDIPDQDYSSALITVGGAVNYLKSRGIVDGPSGYDPYDLSSLNAVKLQALEAISEKFDISVSQIAPLDEFVNDYGADQIDMWELLELLKDIATVNIMQEEIQALITVDDALTFVSSLFYARLPDNVIAYSKSKNHFVLKLKSAFAEAAGLASASDVYPRLSISSIISPNDMDLFWTNLMSKLVQISSSLQYVEISRSTIDTFYDLFEVAKYRYWGPTGHNYYGDINRYSSFPSLGYAFPWPDLTTFPDPIEHIGFGTYYFNPPENTITLRQKKIGYALSRFMENLDEEKDYKDSNGNVADPRFISTHSAKVFRQGMEYVCKYLQDIGITSSYQPMTVPEFITFSADPQKFTLVDIPQTGDLYILQEYESSGPDFENFHVGIIRSFNQQTRLVTILDEFSYGITNNAGQNTVHYFGPHMMWMPGMTARVLRPNI